MEVSLVDLMTDGPRSTQRRDENNVVKYLIKPNYSYEQIIWAGAGGDAPS